MRDLFRPEEDAYFTDAELLARLAEEKLAEAATAVAAEGWAWVEVEAVLNYERLARFGRLEPHEEAAEPEEEKRRAAAEGEGWSQHLINEVERQYRQFLKLSALPGPVVVPTKLIDVFWHAHILDTRKYAEDCDQIFGRFLHHFPYFGMRGEQDRENLQKSFLDTLRRVEEVFGAGWHTVSQESSGICTSCGTSDCAPDPSCGSDPTPGVHYDVVQSHLRPTFGRASA